MPFKHLKYILYIALAFFLSETAKAQYTLNMTAGTSYISGTDHPVGVIYDDGGPSANYSNSFHGRVIITSTPGSTIYIYGSYNTEIHYDYISIYDGSDSSALMQASLNGIGTIEPMPINTGCVAIEFETDPLDTRSGFEIHYECCPIDNSGCSKPSDLVIDSITTTSARLSWHADNPTSTFVVKIGGDQYVTNDTSLIVNGLQEYCMYNVIIYNIDDSASICCQLRSRFHTLCSYGQRIAYDDLYASNVTCHYGTFDNPYQHTGIIDQSSQSILPRHTIHLDRNEMDPRTNYLLKCVPDGYCSSVRLGNWNVGSEAESITYTFNIDTTDYNLLILKYAAVMQDPNHSAIQQPKFQFGIYDSQGNTINDCYNATFVSSSQLGWNTGASNNILWKDWTTVGVDLAPLHGQTITLRLTTYDCSKLGHYGYAYFVLDLANKNMLCESCSTIENTFYAPSGFNYAWYRVGQEDNILSTADSLHVTTGGYYQCRLSFIGAPNDAAHANCSFTLNAYAGQRYPVAAFHDTVIDTSSYCNARIIKMINSSYVTTDPEHTHLLQNRCESYLWDFGDSTTSTETNPTHTFTPGLHNVTLYAMLANGECTDSLTLTINAGEYCHNYDTTYATICENDSAIFFDSAYYQTGTYTHADTNATTQVIDCSILELTVNPSVVNSIFDTIVQNSIPYTHHGTTYTHDADTTTYWTGTRPACDTIEHYHLKVWPNIYDTILHYICHSEVPLVDGDIAFFNDSTATVSRRGAHGEDSVVTYIVHIIPSTDSTIYDTIVDSQLPWFVLDTVFNDSVADYIYITTNEAGCDSTIHYFLHIFWNGDHCDTNLTYPNVVTSNNDGINDRFVIGGLLENNCFKFNELIIYDRSGRQVYRTQNIYDESQWWDPKAERCSDGTYFYVFRAHGVSIHTFHKGVIEVLSEEP